jgi:hypothetical protein
MIKFLVTEEKFDQNFSIEEWLNFFGQPSNVIYNKMLLFVVDENNEYLEEKKARELFKSIPKKEWLDYVAQFAKAINEAFVNPMNGGS